MKRQFEILDGVCIDIDPTQQGLLVVPEVVPPSDEEVGGLGDVSTSCFLERFGFCLSTAFVPGAHRDVLDDGNLLGYFSGSGIHGEVILAVEEMHLIITNPKAHRGVEFFKRKSPESLPVVEVDQRNPVGFFRWPVSASAAGDDDLATVVELLRSDRNTHVNAAFGGPDNLAGLEVESLKLGPHFLWRIGILVRKLSVGLRGVDLAGEDNCSVMQEWQAATDSEEFLFPNRFAIESEAGDAG